jgi:hypothetical protein
MESTQRRTLRPQCVSASTDLSQYRILLKDFAKREIDQHSAFPARRTVQRTGCRSSWTSVVLESSNQNTLNGR